MAAEPRSPEQRIRDGLVALADYLTDRDDYDLPVRVIEALCGDGVDEKTREVFFRSLLLMTSERGADRTRPLPCDAETDLDYLTGARP